MVKEKIQKELTKAELEVMQIIGEKKKVLAREVLDEMPDSKPAYNTFSTVIRVLEKKGFVYNITKLEFDCICKLDSLFKTDTNYGFSYPNYISACKGLAYID